MVYFIAAKPEPGVVVVTTRPGDAGVSFDGKPVGSTSPFVITGVAPNEQHTLDVRKDGYQAWSQKLEVQPGETLQVSATLERAYVAPPRSHGGALSIETTPQGANVWLDGQKLPVVTPVRLGYLAPKQYEVRLHLAGYREHVLKVDVRVDRMESPTRVTLQAERFHVRITSEPPKASAVLTRGEQQRRLGLTPLRVTLENDDAPWQLAVSRAGFIPYEQSLVVDDGAAELNVHAQLKRKGHASSPPAPAVGTFRLASRPWSEVFVDGKIAGTTPRHLVLSAGHHRITLVRPGYLRKHVDVNTKSGESQTLVVELQECQGGGECAH